MIKTAKRTGYSQFLHRLVETLEVSIFSSSNRRAKAAKALGWLGEPMAIEPLVIALIDRSNVRSESVIALTKIDPNWRESIGAQKAIPALLKRLHLVPKSVAAQALVTLSKTKTLLESLRDNRDPGFRVLIANILGQAEDNDAVELIVALLDDENWVRDSRGGFDKQGRYDNGILPYCTLLEALGKFSGESAEKKLRGYLSRLMHSIGSRSSGDIIVRLHGGVLRPKIGEFMPVLAKSLVSDDSEKRISARGVFEAIASAQEVPELVAILKREEVRDHSFSGHDYHRPQVQTVINTAQSIIRVLEMILARDARNISE